jgi:peptide/nickel transport system substrate-binding protein
MIAEAALQEDVDAVGLSILSGAHMVLVPRVVALLRANGQDAWFGWPTSERLESLRDAWFEAPDLPAQQAIGRQIQAAFFEDVPYWPLGQFYGTSAYRKGLKIGRRGLPIPLNVSRET